MFPNKLQVEISEHISLLKTIKTNLYFNFPPIQQHCLHQDTDDTFTFLTVVNEFHANVQYLALAYEYETTFSVDQELPTRL